MFYFFNFEKKKVKEVCQSKLVLRSEPTKNSDFFVFLAGKTDGVTVLKTAFRIFNYFSSEEKTQSSVFSTKSSFWSVETHSWKEFTFFPHFLV